MFFDKNYKYIDFKSINIIVCCFHYIDAQMDKNVVSKVNIFFHISIFRSLLDYKLGYSLGFDYFFGTTKNCRCLQVTTILDMDLFIPLSNSVKKRKITQNR